MASEASDEHLEEMAAPLVKPLADAIDKEIIAAYEPSLDSFDLDKPHPLDALKGQVHEGLPKLTQSSRWSCIPTAFAMVLGRGNPAGAGNLLSDIMEQLGRDDERGFHVQELLGIAITLGVAFVPFDAQPELERAPCQACNGTNRGLPCAVCKGARYHSAAPMNLWPLAKVLASQDGVLVGSRTDKPHAVAWCSRTQQVLDPEGGVYGIEDFNVVTFWAAFSIGD